MDEYNSGMDPEVKKYFRKILNSFSAGLLWLLTVATSGLFFRLGIIEHTVRWYHVIFYLTFVITLGILIRYYFKIWNDKAA